MTERWAKTHKDLKRWGESRSQVSSGGLWHKEEHTYMHFNVVQPGGVLYGLTFFYFDDQQNLKSIRSARRASFVNNGWLLEDVVETWLGDTRVTTEANNTQEWQTEISPQALVFLASQPEDMSARELHEYGKYLKQNNIDNTPYSLAFWQKLLQPLAIFSLVVIALSFVFGPLRSTTIGFRIFIGVVVGIAFQFAQNLLGPASLIYGFSPLLAVCIPVALCTLVGFILLTRAG